MNNEPVAWLINGKLFEEYFKTSELDNIIPLYTHPAKELHLSLQKTEDGELVAVTYTDDEHRIVEVLWKKPPAKTLTDEEIVEVFDNTFKVRDFEDYFLKFARAILKKASEK